MMKVVFFVAILAFGDTERWDMAVWQYGSMAVWQFLNCLDHIKSCQTPAELGKNYVFAFDRPFKEYCPIAQL